MFKNFHQEINVLLSDNLDVTYGPILYSFAFSSPLGHKIYKEPRIKLFNKINKSVLSHMTFCLEDDDHKPVDFNNKKNKFYLLTN